MKKIIKLGVFVVLMFLIVNQLPKALDDNYKRNYEMPAQQAEQEKQERLDEILSDGFIDESEVAEYEKLIGDF